MLSRRSFLKRSVAAAAATMVSGPVVKAVASSSSAMTPGPGNKWPGRVVINFNKNAVTGTSTPATAVIQQMVDDCIMRLTGLTGVGEAWKAVFPETLTLQSKIAVKINTANTNLPCPHWASVKQITAGLRQMDFNGTKFPGAGITIYDMNFLDGFEKAGFSKTNFPDIALVYTTLADGGDGAMGNKKYASTLKEADFLINVFSPRGHTYPPEGSQFTLGFKSHVGTYASEYKGEGPALHENLLQNLRDMNCTGPVFKKNVLSVCSGIFGMNEGHGPGGSADPFYNYAKTMDSSITSKSASSTTMLMSTDPVSIEMQAVKLLRLNKNPAGGYAVADMPPYLKAAAGISGALPGTCYTIGVIDEAKMNVRRIINGVTSIGDRRLSEQGTKSNLHVSPLAGHSTTFIEFSLPPEARGKNAILEVVTLSGALVKRRKLPVLGPNNHYSWDNRNEAGISVKGPLVVKVTCGKSRLSAKCIIPG